jgi:hypothetical protein
MYVSREDAEQDVWLALLTRLPHRPADRPVGPWLWWEVPRAMIAGLRNGSNTGVIGVRYGDSATRTNCAFAAYPDTVHASEPLTPGNATALTEAVAPDDGGIAAVDSADFVSHVLTRLGSRGPTHRRIIAGFAAGESWNQLQNATRCTRSSLHEVAAACRKLVAQIPA